MDSVKKSYYGLAACNCRFAERYEAAAHPRDWVRHAHWCAFQIALERQLAVLGPGPTLLTDDPGDEDDGQVGMGLTMAAALLVIAVAGLSLLGMVGGVIVMLEKVLAAIST